MTSSIAPWCTGKWNLGNVRGLAQTSQCQLSWTSMLCGQMNVYVVR